MHIVWKFNAFIQYHGILRWLCQESLSYITSEQHQQHPHKEIPNMVEVQSICNDIVVMRIKKLFSNLISLTDLLATSPTNSWSCSIVPFEIGIISCLYSLAKRENFGKSFSDISSLIRTTPAFRKTKNFMKKYSEIFLLLDSYL